MSLCPGFEGSLLPDVCFLGSPCCGWEGESFWATGMQPVHVANASFCPLSSLPYPSFPPAPSTWIPTGETSQLLPAPLLASGSLNLLHTVILKAWLSHRFCCFLCLFLMFPLLSGGGIRGPHHCCQFYAHLRARRALLLKHWLFALFPAAERH